MTFRCARSLVLFLFVVSPALARSVELSAPDFRDVTRDVAVGEWVTISGIDLGPEEAPASLELRRYELFAADARLMVNGASGPRAVPVPDNRYFRGFVEGEVQARAAVSVLASGEIRGLILGTGRYWMLANRLDGERLDAPQVREVDYDVIADKASTFSCATDALNRGGEPRQVGLPFDPASAPAYLGPEPTYAARISVDSDWEFRQLFASNVEAFDYMADMIAYSHVVYSDEVDTSMNVGSLTVWDDPADPWSEFSTVCGLFEFGRHWNDNNADVERTIAHLMSGKNNGGGVAWVGVLCQEAFDFDTAPYGCGLLPLTDNYGGDYGYSGTMDGDFDLGNPVVLWDVVVTAHEMGHNFNSPHTHCYNGIGDPSPIDECNGSQQGCYSGPTSLPDGCPGSGMGCGTIMSYCHLLGGGIANIGWTLGQGHPYGILPGRVPSRMNDAVVVAHDTFPNCLPLTDQIFGSSFEGGDTDEWDADVQ